MVSAQNSHASILPLSKRSIRRVQNFGCRLQWQLQACSPVCGAWQIEFCLYRCSHSSPLPQLKEAQPERITTWGRRNAALSMLRKPPVTARTSSLTAQQATASWQASELQRSHRKPFASFSLWASIKHPLWTTQFISQLPCAPSIQQQHWFVSSYSAFPQRGRDWSWGSGCRTQTPWSQQQPGKVLAFTTAIYQKKGDESRGFWSTRRSAIYLPQRRMDIKEEGPVNVVTSHLPKVGFIPTGKNKHRTTYCNADNCQKIQGGFLPPIFHRVKGHCRTFYKGQCIHSLGRQRGAYFSLIRQGLF